MGIDISTGVGYGISVTGTGEVKKKIVGIYNRFKPDNDLDPSYIQEYLEGMYSFFPGLTFEYTYGENGEEDIIDIFVRELEMGSSDKYEAFRTTLLPNNPAISDETRTVLTQLQKLLDVPEDSLGWYFYKKVW